MKQPILTRPHGKKVQSSRTNSTRPKICRPKLAHATSAADTICAPDLSGDILQIYFREIGRVALLTPKEERALARKVRRGDKAAREQMITANLRLVVKIAREYEGLGLPLPDLINDGNLGLMKAVNRFQPAMGTKLSTYASWRIRQAIKRALSNHGKTIRLPVHVVERLARIRKAELKLREQWGRVPGDAAIARVLRLTPRQVRECRAAARATISLEAPLGEDASTTVAETVADANAVIPSEQLLKNTDTQLLREVLATLKPREREILVKRFGLDDGEPQRLEAVGKGFGITRERVRQIQDQALSKLRTKIERRNRANGHADNERNASNTKMCSTKKTIQTGWRHCSPENPTTCKPVSAPPASRTR